MTEDLRLKYLHGKISSLEAEIADLQREYDGLNNQLDKLGLKFITSLLEDRLLSAIRHRKSRIPVLIDCIEREILIVRADIDRHYTYY